MWRLLWVAGGLLYAACLSGCTRLEEALMPVPAKVNAAFPMSSDAHAARDRLQGMLAADSNAAAALKAQSESRMTLRALNCSKNVSVGRMDSIASVRALPLDRQCFQDQDKDLLAFYAVRTIGTLLALPARYTALYVYDESTPIACNVSFVERPYWEHWRQSMTPIHPQVPNSPVR